MAVGGDGVLVTCRSRGGHARDAWPGGAIAGAAATDAARCRRGSRTRRRATCRSGRPTELACRWRQGRHAAASARALPAHASRPLVVRACSSALRLLRGLVCNGGGGNAARDSKRCGARRQGGQAGEWSSDNPFDEPVDGAAQRRASTVGSKALRSSSRKHAIYYWKGMYTWNVRRQTAWSDLQRPLPSSAKGLRTFGRLFRETEGGCAAAAPPAQCAPSCNNDERRNVEEPYQCLKPVLSCAQHGRK